MVDWWSETEEAILEHLTRGGRVSPGDIARRLRISESEATMFVCMLAREGKARICLVEAAGGSASPFPLPEGERESREVVPVEVGSGWA